MARFWEVSARLDEAGRFSFEMPAADEQAVALGGSWGSSGASTGLVEVEIESYLNVNLRSEHTIEFSCSGGEGRLVNVEVECFVQVQAIAVT